METARFAKSERRRIGSLTLPVATGRVRLLGLAHLDRAEAGPGLIIPRCHSIHTWGMRFPLHVAFMDSGGHILRLSLGVPPGRFLSRKGADFTVELVPGETGTAEGIAALLGGAGPVADRAA